MRSKAKKGMIICNKLIKRHERNKITMFCCVGRGKGLESRPVWYLKGRKPERMWDALRLFCGLVTNGNNYIIARHTPEVKGQFTISVLFTGTKKRQRVGKMAVYMSRFWERNFPVLLRF